MMKDYFKCNTCEYKENRKRGVIKCVFLSVIFSVLAFVLGVAVGLQVPAQTAHKTIISASAEEVSSTPSKWNPDWVQAPADWVQYGDNNNSFNLQNFASLFSQNIPSHVTSYNIEYSQSLNENRFIFSGVSSLSGSNFPISIPWGFVESDPISGVFDVSQDNVLGVIRVALAEQTSSDYNYISSSNNGAFNFSAYSSIAAPEYFLEFLLSVGDNGVFRCELSYLTDKGTYQTPYSYICDYYYNLGLDASGGGGYTEEDLRKEYDRGYDLGWSDGRYYGYELALKDLRVGFLDNIAFYNRNYFYFLERWYPEQLEQVMPRFVENSLYFNYYYQDMVAKFVKDGVVSAADKYEAYAFSANWKLDFLTPINAGSLSALRFESISDAYNAFFDGSATVYFTSGISQICFFKHDDLSENPDVTYILDISSANAFEQIDYIEFSSSVDVRALFNDDASLNEQFQSGIYGVRLYSSLDGKVDGGSYNLGYARGYDEGKKVADAQVAKENFDKGYSKGLAKAEKFDFTYAVSTVVGAPVQVVKEFLNFEILGVNMISFISGVITLLIIIKCLKLML